MTSYSHFYLTFIFLSHFETFFISLKKLLKCVGCWMKCFPVATFQLDTVCLDETTKMHFSPFCSFCKPHLIPKGEKRQRKSDNFQLFSWILWVENTSYHTIDHMRFSWMKINIFHFKIKYITGTISSWDEMKIWKLW